MSTTDGVTAHGLTSRASEEVRALLGRRRMSATELARQMGVSQAYIWRRLDGRTSFDLDDIEAIARILGVEPVELLGLAERSGVQMNRRFSATPERPPGNSLAPVRRPADTRPDGRPHSGQRRPERVAYQPVAA